MLGEEAPAVITAGLDDDVVVAFELVELPLVVVVGTELLVVTGGGVVELLLSTVGMGLGVVEVMGGTSVESWYMEAHSARLNC